MPRLLRGVAVLLLVVAVGWAGNAAAKPQQTVPPSFSGCSPQPTIAPTLPSEMTFPSQANANCLAWQEFVDLNWQAAPGQCGVPDNSVGAAKFGTPGNTAPVVWETYQEASQVFKPGAAQPDPWCASQTLPSAMGGPSESKTLKPTSTHGFKALFEDSKFETTHLSFFKQASEGDPWLTAQNGHLTMYEIRVDRPEYDYIVQNKLYNADVQQQFVTTQGINLPDGSVEIKAAWLELDSPSLYPLYKTSRAIVQYPGGKPHPVIVGLVGLHIIQKTPDAQQFIWATFEHVGLDPTVADIKAKNLTPPYTYYNPTCNPSTDHYHCAVNTAPMNNSPDYQAPLQAARFRPISSASTDNVVGLNEAMWNLIAASDPNSVFLHYQLVDALWPTSSTPIPPAAMTPLTDGAAAPDPVSQPVANTSLETFIQNRTCLYCHASAPIASTSKRATVPVLPPLPPSRVSGPLTPSSLYASDYSFLFQTAQSPSAAGFPTWTLALLAVAGANGCLAGLVFLRRRRTRSAFPSL